MSDHPKVAIFWDYENCSPPSNSCGLGYDIVNNIRRIARLFGSVTTFRAYLDISAQSPKSVVLRSELQSSGVSMIDCPHNGRKDVVDKMILVDMLAFAIDHPIPATIMLIAGDRDYAYAVSILKLRRYQVILVVPSSEHASPCLESQASLVIDWGAAVLRNRTEAVISMQAVRQPYLDLDANLVAKVLGELQELSLDDTDTTLHLNPTTSRLRRVSARDLLEPSKHSMNTGSVDSTQEFTHASASPKKSTSAANDWTPGGLPIPRTPSRSRHASVSTGSTRVRSTTIATQSPPALEQATPAKNPPPSSARDITDVARPVQHGLPALPPPDAPELPFRDNCSTGEMPVKSGAPSSRGLNCLASPFVTTKVPAGSESTPNPCTVKPTSPVMAPVKTLADTVTTAYQTPKDIGVTKEVEHLTGLRTEDNDGNSERSIPFRVCPKGDARNATDTSNYRPYLASPTLYSPSRRNVGLHPTDSDTPSGKHVSPPTAMFLGVVDSDSDDDSVQLTASSRASSALDHSAPDSVSVLSFNTVPSTPFTTAEAHEHDESEQRHKWTLIFRPLIYLLLVARERGIAHPSRSTIASDLVQSDKQVYQRAGVSRFRDYTLLAEQAGVIKLGGIGGDAWIALHPNWFGVEDITTAHFLSSRVSSPTSDPPEVIANPSLTGSRNPLMERVASFQPLTAFSGGNTLPTSGTDRLDGASRVSLPAQFRPLIDILVQMRAEGFHQIIRSIVGQLLGQDVYAQAGVPGFREYIHQASEAQLVQCGGVGNHAWIRLHPELRT